jgi:uncharacterized protein
VSRRGAGATSRSPWRLDTRDLARRPGSTHAAHRELPAPAGWALELVRVPEGATVELDLRLESVVEGVLATGRIRGPLVGECGRCLDRAEDVLDVAFQELYAYPDRATSGDAAAEVSHLDGDVLDLEPALRDAVVLSLPLTPLCSPDCAGLCGQCGQRLAEDPGHGHEEPDPRWAGPSAMRTVPEDRPEEE